MPLPVGDLGKPLAIEGQGDGAGVGHQELQLPALQQLDRKAQPPLGRGKFLAGFHRIFQGVGQ